MRHGAVLVGRTEMGEGCEASEGGCGGVVLVVSQSDYGCSSG